MGPFPFELKFDPVVPVYGKGSPGELGNAAGGQAAGEEKGKGPEARKEEGQSAAAEAPTAVAPVDSESEDVPVAAGCLRIRCPLEEMRQSRRVQQCAPRAERGAR